MGTFRTGKRSLGKPLCLGAALVLASLAFARTSQAEFGFIGGALNVTAGELIKHAPVNAYAPASVAAASPDSVFVQGLASITPALNGSRRFDFELQSTSTTNQADPAGNPNSSAAFSQPLALAEAQRLTLTAIVGDSGNANATVAISGPGVSVTLGDTNRLEEIRSVVAPRGSFSLNGSAVTAAQSFGAHTATLHGSLLITELADLDGDLIVSGADFLRIQRGFGQPADAATFLTGDVNGDSNVTADDVALFAQQFGPVAEIIAATAVPEPTPKVLALIAYLAAQFPLRRQRRP